MAYSTVSLLFLTITLTSSYANKLSLDFHHRFSDKVQQWTKAHGLPPPWMPEEAPQGTVEYYQRLLKYDFHRHHGRSLADGDLYAFAGGNDTFVYLGHLHYAFVDLGTPNQTFLVALDTGSDQFWVPCNCKQCAPMSDPLYKNMVFRNYEPQKSSTSVRLLCSSNQCFTMQRSQCTDTSADCTYTIKYGSGSTSSSGTLVQDDLYLIKEDITLKTVKLPIVFGCGEVQTGDLLHSVPNGLMGLGLGNLSVPSLIAESGLISDSFSMCFGLDGYGEINFGDKGSADQNETELNMNSSPYYKISLTEVSVGSNVTKLSSTAIVDSGNTYSRFTNDIFTKIGKSFSAQVSEKPTKIDGNLFEYCFAISENQTEINPPIIYFTTKGGSSFEVLRPVVYIVNKDTRKTYAYCLGIIRDTMNIIGENFLNGQLIVFNREQRVLGWKPHNCSVSNHTGIPPIPQPTSVSAPSRYVGPSTVMSVITSLVPITIIWVLFY